jgi:hypothetical protein
MAKALRPDLVFSYWIYAWFILYACKYLKYSPKFALILGLLDNAVMLLLMCLFGTSVRTIVYFVIVNTIIKVVPLYYLRQERIKWADIYFTCGLFFIFVVWLHINEQSLVGNIKIIHDSLLYGNNKTPFMSLLSSMEKNYKNIQVL